LEGLIIPPYGSAIYWEGLIPLRRCQKVVKNDLKIDDFGVSEHIKNDTFLVTFWTTFLEGYFHYGHYPSVYWGRISGEGSGGVKKVLKKGQNTWILDISRYHIWSLEISSKST